VALVVLVADSSEAQETPEAPARLVWQSEAGAFSHRGGVGDLALSPDGRFLVTYENSGRGHKAFLLWDVSTGRLDKRLEPDFNDRGGAHSVAYSPDGKLILGCWGLGYATVFDAKTGRPRFTKKLHDETILNSRFLPDGAHILTSGSDGKLSVTRVADQAVVATWSFLSPGAAEANSPFGDSPESPAAMSIDVSSNGGRVLMTRYKANASEFIVWQIGSDAPVVRIERPNADSGGGRAIHTAVFSKDGKFVLTAGNRVVLRESTALTSGPQQVQVLEIRRWDAGTGELLAEHVATDVPGYGYIYASPDGQTFATSDYGGIHLWRQGENKPHRYIALPGSHGGTPVQFTPDGRRLVVGTGNTISIWDLATGERVGGGDSSIKHVTAAAWGAGNRIAVGRGNMIEIWDADSRKPQRTISLGESRWVLARSNSALQLQFSRDGKTLFAAAEIEVPSARMASVVRYWDVESGEMRGEVTNEWSMERDQASLAIAPDASMVAMQTLGISLFNLADGTKVAEAQDLRSLRAMQFSRDGRSIWTVSEAGQVVRWEPEQNGRQDQYMAEWRTADDGASPQDFLAVVSAVFSPDAASLAISHERTSRTNRSPALVFWDNELKQVKKVLRNQPVYQLAISPDGRRLAGIEIDASGHVATDAIHVWDVATGRELFTLQPRDARATAMAFSPDGKQLLTGFDRGTYAIWDVQ
jgi:WD40 repeat protein